MIILRSPVLYKHKKYNQENVTDVINKTEDLLSKY